MKRVYFYPHQRIFEICTLKLVFNHYHWVPLGNSLGCKDKFCTYPGFCKDCDRKIVNLTNV